MAVGGNTEITVWRPEYMQGASRGNDNVLYQYYKHKVAGRKYHKFHYYGRNTETKALESIG